MSDFVVNRPIAGALRPARPRPLGDGRRFALHVGGIAALALVLAASDAFGSDDLPLGRRLLMFGVVSALLVLQASMLAEAARRAWGSSRIGMAAAAASVMAAMLVLMTVEIHMLKATPIVPYAPDPLPEFALFLMPFVVPVSALVLGLQWSGRGDGEALVPAAPERDGPLPAPGAAIDGWPSDPVRRVRAVDHYLEFLTPRGTILVRGRMRDALVRLPAGGLHPHRSWWVALSEIERIERRGRDHVLLLKDGERVPVARARAEAVRRVLRARLARPKGASSPGWRRAPAATGHRPPCETA